MKKKVIFVLPTLGIGGAERVITNIVNHLDFNVFDITILILKSSKHSYANLLNSNVKLVNLNHKGKLRYSFLAILKYIRKEKPKTVFMAMGDLNVLIAPFIPFFSKIDWIARETNTVSVRVTSFFVKWLYRVFYKNYTLIVAQGKGMKEDLVNHMNVSPSKIKIINNPIDNAVIDEALLKAANVKLPNDKINLLACGRLTYQKGFDLLLQEYANIPDVCTYHLTIVGTGLKEDRKDQEELLKSLILDLGIQEYVSFIGHQSNIYPILKQADFFISSSRFEGFPNVVLEALYCGVPVLANDYGQDIRDLLKITNYGYIFDFSKKGDFLDCMNRAIIRNWEQVKLKPAMKNYFVDIIVKEYSKIL